jgi:ABC-type spermidine/putrescine transport system permease subunit II
VAQGTLGIYGNEWTVMLWYIYFFSPLSLLLILGQPILFDSALLKASFNQRVTIDDYMDSIFLPVIWSAVFVGAGLFSAVAVSDSLIARYVGGSARTLGVVLSNHQESSLAPGDFVFLAWLAVFMLVALFGAGLFLNTAQRRIWTPESSRSLHVRGGDEIETL